MHLEKALANTRKHINYTLKDPRSETEIKHRTFMLSDNSVDP